ncbi:hypothetical protein CHS0354_029083 [Potamilus streckersoni]|uniref:Uncharacterized protein n=1 Tax=Potamilus streckersoni TaxID=2493646 RepID=A0AAE0W3Z1_9BIVA|nr:hypothetical protein CHS0354_029083 [Potamilus streckersoni]
MQKIVLVWDRQLNKQHKHKGETTLYVQKLRPWVLIGGFVQQTPHLLVNPPLSSLNKCFGYSPALIVGSRSFNGENTVKEAYIFGFNRGIIGLLRKYMRPLCNGGEDRAPPIRPSALRINSFDVGRLVLTFTSTGLNIA